MRSLIFLYVLISFVDCRHATPPPPPAHMSTVQLTLEDALCTEVWFNLAFTDTAGARDFVLVRKDAAGASETLLAGQLLGNDTTLVDTSAQPASNYTYFAYRMNGSTMVDWSSDVVVTTMPTTSHNFTWKIDTLGSGGSSYFKDVAIINDNDVWAVGEVYLSGETTRYNAAVWNGSSWNLRRVPYYYQNQPSYNLIQTIFAFNANDIWLAGNGVIHWDGQNYVSMAIPSSVWGPYLVNRIWGTNGLNLFIVGDGGSVARFDGNSWQNMETHTTIDLKDAWGRNDGKEIWVCGSSNDNRHSILLKCENNQWQTVWERNGFTPVAPFGYNIGSGWKSCFNYVTTSDGVYRIRDSVAEKMSNNFSDYSRSLRCNGENDMLTVGENGRIWHFDGIFWRQLAINSNWFLIGSGFKYNTAIAVGTDFSVGLGVGLIYVGKRSQ